MSRESVEGTYYTVDTLQILKSFPQLSSCIDQLYFRCIYRAKVPQFQCRPPRICSLQCLIATVFVSVLYCTYSAPCPSWSGIFSPAWTHRLSDVLCCQVLRAGAAVSASPSSDKPSALQLPTLVHTIPLQLYRGRGTELCRRVFSTEVDTKNRPQALPKTMKQRV